jgi:hypothetical protein
VSIRQLYEKIPIEKRLCPFCGTPIHRNIAIINGQLCHYGCMNKAGLKPTHKCLDCYSYLTPDNIIRASFTPGQQATKTCGNCGSPNLKSLGRR